MSSPDITPGWWSSLKHGGLLIAPSRLQVYVDQELEPLPDRTVTELRRGVVGMLSTRSGNLGELLDTVLEEVLGLERAHWAKATDVGAEWSHRAITRETIKPRRIWKEPGGGVLPVFAADTLRVGVGRGRRAVSRVIEWLRKADLKVAVLTNGRQWRLIHAGADYDAWCEWDAELWFQEGELGPQVAALRRLLGGNSLRELEPDEPSPLNAAILASRKGQAELSTALGERVRQAVELLIEASSDSLDPIDQADAAEHVPREAIYIAATRMVMRCVVVLFAEARDLLPRDNPIYHGSYGLQGLREQLDRRAGGRGADRLRHSHSAWPRLVALFRLVYHGSAHEALPITRYGGGLFEPGSLDADDPILRALAAFESPANKPSDADVHQILEKLTQSPVKVRQGNRNTWVMAPVDFSDLSTEYIGILYEGLLDFELRRAPDDDPMLFLKIGDQPTLPLSRIEAMSDKEIANLVEKLGKPSRKSLDEDDEAGNESGDSEDLGAEEAAAAEEEGEHDAATPEDDDDLDDEPDDRRQALRDRAHAWAVRAVTAGNIVRKPRGRSREALDKYEQEVARAARGLLERVVLPGDWFLVRWGGTRKGQAPSTRVRNWPRQQHVVPCARLPTSRFRSTGTRKPGSLRSPSGSRAHRRRSSRSRSATRRWAPPLSWCRLCASSPRRSPRACTITAASSPMARAPSASSPTAYPQTTPRKRPSRCRPSIRSSMSGCADVSSATSSSVVYTASIWIRSPLNSPAWRSGSKPWIRAFRSGSSITSSGAAIVWWVVGSTGSRTTRCSPGSAREVTVTTIASSTTTGSTCRPGARKGGRRSRRATAGPPRSKTSATMCSRRS